MYFLFRSYSCLVLEFDFSFASVLEIGFVRLPFGFGPVLLVRAGEKSLKRLLCSTRTTRTRAQKVLDYF